MECLLQRSYLCRLQFISICFAISFAAVATAADPKEVDNLKPLKERVPTQAEQEALALEQELEALEVNIKRLVDRINIILKDRKPESQNVETEQPPKNVEVDFVKYVDHDINDSYIYIKIESFGDVRPSEASIKNVVLTLDNKPIFTDGNSVDDGGQAFKYSWGVFSDGTNFMKMYGYQRGSHADVYGDREGLWVRFKTKTFLTKSVIQNMPHKVQLSVDFRFGRGNRDPRKRYEILLGIGKGGDNGYKNFDVLARKIAASSATVPGNKDWETYEMGFLLQYKPADVDDLKALK